MKKLSAAVLATAFLFSCNNQKGSGSFTLSGELKGAKNQRVFLEEILFTGVAPQVLDTGDIKDGVFTVKAVAKEEGMIDGANKKIDEYKKSTKANENIPPLLTSKRAGVRPKGSDIVGAMEDVNNKYDFMKDAKRTPVRRNR